MATLILIHSSDNWKIFPGGGIMDKIAHKKNLKELKNYVDDPNSDESLKVDILGWMWDNLKKINSSDSSKRNKKYHREMMAFLTLINNS